MTPARNDQRPDGGRARRKTRARSTPDSGAFEVVTPRTIGQLRSLKAGGIELDLDGRRVLVAGRQLLLRPKEFHLLRCLMERAGVTVGRRDLLDELWGNAHDMDPKALNVYVMRLRKQLIDGGAVDRIQTVRGEGYVFDPS
jgi:DNA-binding response OmpR family regulator